MIYWRDIGTAPKDGTWVLLKGGLISETQWDGDTQPPCVCAQWTHERNGRPPAREGWWQFAWYDGGYYGEYEKPTMWALVS